MDTFILEKDIIVHYMEASSFPDGVLDAHQTLHQLVELSNQRKHFGISWMGQNGDIIYKAAAEELNPVEFRKHLLPTFIIKQGSYSVIDVPEFMEQAEGI